MAVFSRGNIYGTGHYSESSIGEDLSYAGALGAYQMMEESNINTHRIFEHVLGVDFAEASADYGYISESTYEAINEASGTGIFSKVVEFFKKLGEKIKGIIKNLIDKITAMFTKDAKELYNKFKDQINRKISENVYDSNFKYKWCKLKQQFGTDKDVNLTEKMFDVKCELSENAFIHKLSINDNQTDGVGQLKKFIDSAGKDQSPNFSEAKKRQDDNLVKNDPSDKKLVRNKLQAAYDAQNGGGKHYFNTATTDDLNDYEDKLLSTILYDKESGTDRDSFKQDFDEQYFDSEEEKEGFSNYNDIAEFLQKHKDITSALEKTKSNTDKSIKKFTDGISKIQRDLEKRAGKDYYSEWLQTFRGMATTLTAMGNRCSSATTKYYAEYGAAIKKYYAQCRKVWIKAATYNKRSAKNEATLYEAYEEISDYDVDMMMPEF